MEKFDLAVIGAGPGGYVAAIRAAQLGAKVALVEGGEIGGVCLNRGCIPTKALIASAHALSAARRAGEFGIALPGGEPRVDMPAAVARKDRIVGQLKKGVASLLAANGVELIRGAASFTGPGAIAVDGAPLDARNVLIATGSSWMELPDIRLDGERIVTSDEALGWTAVPETLAIIGGGVVGCEFACMMRAFGAKVTIIEATPSILPPVERAISRLLVRSMKDQGIEILTDATVKRAEAEGEGVRYELATGEVRQADRMIVAVGRRARTADLNLEAAGVALTERGFIKVDGRFKTTGEGTFAIGDVIGQPMLAHAASAEGVAAVEGIFGGAADHDPSSCPSPIFTSPEIASVGRTSEDLEKNGVAFKTGRFPFAANGKALCDGEAQGQAIVHADGSGKILGVHIFGRDATLLIAEAALALHRGFSARDLASAIHSHPTLSEAIAEAALDIAGSAIHKAPARKK